MYFGNALKRVYAKIAIFFGVFVVIFIAYFFLINFYSRILIQKINEIAFLKEKIIQRQISLEKENKIKRLITLIEQKSNKELPAILFNIQQKINRDFEAVKNLVLENIQKENWQIKTTNFNQQENKLNFVFQITDKDFDNFYNFMIDSGLIWQTINLKLNKVNNFWEIDLTLQSK
jgi:predicted PurR-regulated permease PerM